jgi:2-hydroxy-3-keto-5-methylthiopentenyl-1-phosphate phosphatase
MTSDSDILDPTEARKEFCASLVDGPRQRPRPTIRIFSDFDGTMMKEDVGDALLRQFCGEAHFERMLGLWRSGEISAVECYRRLFAAIPRLTPAMLEEFLTAFEIDPSFIRFAEWCTVREYPLLILSDGFDAYIEPLLRRAGADVEFLANRLRLTEESPVPEFPYADVRCPQLANCKSNHLLLRSQDEDIVVYIGDGTSDYEAAAFADVVFARGALETWCQEQNISFRRFYSFTTVQDVLFILIEQHKLHPRKRARVHRQQLWSTG